MTITETTLQLVKKQLGYFISHFPSTT